MMSAPSRLHSMLKEYIHLLLEAIKERRRQLLVRIHGLDHHDHPTSNKGRCINRALCQAS